MPDNGQTVSDSYAAKSCILKQNVWFEGGILPENVQLDLKKMTDL